MKNIYHKQNVAICILLVNAEMDFNHGRKRQHYEMNKQTHSQSTKTMTPTITNEANKQRTKH